MDQPPRPKAPFPDRPSLLHRIFAALFGVAAVGMSNIGGATPFGAWHQRHDFVPGTKDTISCLAPNGRFGARSLWVE